ncbi:MAG: sigma-70 family RNA polymerase sigma factor [Nitriliruptorales bacterium]
MEGADAILVESALVELLERAAGRGYVVLSELQDFYDPLSQPASWMDDIAQLARERGLEVVDDVSELNLARPEAVTLNVSSDPVRQYLNEIGRTKLLTAEEEIDLSKRYRAGLAARALLADRERLSPRRRAMLALIERDGGRAKDHMIRANLRLVVANARKFRGRGLDFLSLIQEGNVGMMRAVEKFDYTKGYKFSTYATWWIRQALQRSLAAKGRTVRLPAHVFDLLSKIRFAELDLLQALGREPTEDELAAELGMTVERLREIRQAAQDVVSLDTPMGEDGEATLGALIADESAPDPATTATNLLTKSAIVRALSRLNTRERAILMWRFGIMDGEEHSLDEVGAQFGVSRERIRQIEKKTLSKLRHPAAPASQLSSLLDGTE